MAVVGHVGSGFNCHVQRTRYTSGSKHVPGRAGACKLEIVGLNNDVESGCSRYLCLSRTKAACSVNFRHRPKAAVPSRVFELLTPSNFKEVMLTIVLLPGMDGTGSLFAPFISALGNDFNFVTVSYPPTEGLGYTELEDVARQSLPENEKFIILGESFSGPIAVSLASKNPRGLVGMVLCSTFIRNPRPKLEPLSVLSHFLPVKLAPAFIYNYFLLGPAATPSLEASIRAAISQISSTAFRARLRAVLSVDVSIQMKSVQVPVLYIRALQDRLVPPASSSYVSSVHSETQVITVDAPHFLLQVASKEAAGIVKKFAYETCSARFS